MGDYQENVFEKLSRLAMDSHRNGDTKESINWWRKALEESPNHSGVQLNLGALLAQIGEFSEALALFDKVVSEVPDHALAHINMAGCFGHSAIKSNPWLRMIKRLIVTRVP